MKQEIRGVVPILVAPFGRSGNVDLDSLGRLVEFNLRSGVHGLGVALGSEIFRLTESERDLVTSSVVDQVRKRVPIVINTGAPGTDVAVFYSRRAQDLGADAVMVSPPIGPGGPVGADGVLQYFRCISDAVDIPVMIQDVGTAPVPPSLVKEIVNQNPNARYCKMETPPTPKRIADTVSACKGTVGVMGGAGGNYFVEELRRGSTGTMPSCSTPRAFVKVWDLFQAGNVEEATRVFYEQILPVNRLASQGIDHFYHVHKKILERFGVIDCAYVRGPTSELDEATRRELDALVESLAVSAP